MKFKLGDQIQLTDKSPWQTGITGRVAEAPETWLALMENQAERSWCRSVKVKKGEKVFYWVEFDTPQFDNDGDGPYRAAEIQEEMMIHRQI